MFGVLLEKGENAVDQCVLFEMEVGEKVSISKLTRRHGIKVKPNGAIAEEDISRGVDITDDKNIFKTPTLKRKSNIKKHKFKKQDDEMFAVGSECSNSDESVIESENESVSSFDSVSPRRLARSAYTPEKIQSFLQTTKGMKGIRIEEFFLIRVCL